MLEARAVRIAARLHDCSLALRPGQVTAICGPNGAGKSTLLHALAGLLRPASGTVMLEGRPLSAIAAADRARTIGFLPQGGDAAWNLSVRTLVGLGRLPHRSSPAEDARCIDAALDALSLAHLQDRPVHSLSGGERARAMLGRVLAGDPRVVLADEPFASLDLAHQVALMGHLRALADEGRTVALVVHDLALAANHADSVAVLHEGRIAEHGAPDSALAPAVIARIWGIRAVWLGAPGRRALSIEG